MQNRSGGTYNWPHIGGACLIEVAATASGTVHESLDEFEIWPDQITGFHGNR